MNIGVVDIGTNTTRLLITDGQADRVRRSTTTRVGAGVDRTGRLSDEGIERTLQCLRDYAAEIERHGVEKLSIIATSASRDAANRDEFFAAVESILGQPPELVSGEREGRLAFAGATSGLAAAGLPAPYLVLDIGGGSTEFTIGTTEPDGVMSVDVGSVRLTESELHHDPPRPAELTNAIGVVSDHVDDVVRELPRVDEFGTLVGVAGTITTVAAIELGLVTYDRERVHHFRLTRLAAEDVFRTLATEPLADRRHNPGLPADRADIIVGGCCVLVGVMRRLAAPELLVSERDLLDGAAAELLT
jgi:exopolyphosphatase/guanosine-5'-triphosphate,3'-diphosphate pyrophosphatase